MLYAVFFYSFLDRKLNAVNVNESDIKKVGRIVAAWTDARVYHCQTGTVQGAASVTENFHRHLQMNACTSVGIFIKLSFTTNGVVSRKFSSVGDNTFLFFISPAPISALLKFTQLSKLLIIILTCLKEEYLQTLSCGCYRLLALRSCLCLADVIGCRHFEFVCVLRML
jgi:hypothetical protein